MNEQGKKVLTTALRIIAGQPKRVELVEIDSDIRDYFATAPQRGKSLVEFAIEVVVEAIEKSGTQI